jgi:hypothetical protein
MRGKYKIRDQGAIYFVTFTIINWLDVFIRREYRDIFWKVSDFVKSTKGLEVCAEAGIVLSPKEYLYSSAVNYSGRPEILLDVLLI